MKKLFLVNIEATTTGRMAIEAEDAENAREIAQELLDEMRGDWEQDTGSGYAEAKDVQDMPSGTDWEPERKQAEANREAYTELLEERD